MSPGIVSRCGRCGGEIGFGCLGSADCDLNMELLKDGVSPECFRNPAARPEAETGEREAGL